MAVTSRDDLRGLTTAQVEARREEGKGNEERLPTSRSIAHILRANVLTRFNAILGALFAAILVVGPFQDALFGIVLVLNTLIGVVQEIRTKRTLDRLAVLAAPHVRVRRRSEEHTSELQSQSNLVCRLLLEKKKKQKNINKRV